MKFRCCLNHYNGFRILFSLIITSVNFNYSFEDCIDCNSVLNLHTDGPAVLDAPITIKAKIENPNQYEGPFYFTFSK